MSGLNLWSIALVSEDFKERESLDDAAGPLAAMFINMTIEARPPAPDPDLQAYA